jgi:hypothetical protein
MPSQKLPDEVLEAAFQEAVQEVKEKLEVAQEAPPEAPTPGPPTASYRFHRPARQKSFSIPVPKAIDATLLEDLPRRWERQCYVGDVEYVSVEGSEFKMRVRRPGFKKGEHITLDSMTFYPGIGALYGFAEGKRGSFAVRPDQVSFQMPENPPVAPEVASVQEKEVSDATVDGQDPQV